LLEGRTSVEEEQVTTPAQVREIVGSDRRLTVRMVAGEVNMNRGNVYLILSEELGMRIICAKMVSKNLTKQQRDTRVSAVFDI
jgi:hypothetical protein